ncbi:hypothetical protein ACFFIF_01675 [Vagococcus entomophilus]|uniref:Uncharacterized protein n=1 Tax=Vagococcus entomophilus TaxID=1160095 RepID=A0A430AKE7_9ENTE|nr:hypothetical protein [Vagococcus entomophilus]RSU08483.1 hypothetical protein CBF30_04390 [Vagococcus entomophilus]
MTEFTSVLFGMVIAAIIYTLDRYLPKWFGGILGIIYFCFMIYQILTNEQSILSNISILVIGEIILNGIWLSTLQNRKKLKN